MQFGRVKNQKTSSVRIIIGVICFVLCAGVVSGQHQLSQAKAERLYQKGTELVAHENYGAARKVFSDFLVESSHTDPRRSEAEYYVAFSALNLGHTDGEKLIDQYISNNPSTPKAATAYYDLALFFYSDNKFSKALQYFRKVDFPALTQGQQSEGHFKWGYSHFNQKQLDDALTQFNFVKNQSNPWSPAANYYAGFIEYSKGLYDEALTDLRRAEVQASYAPIVPYLIANVYYKQKRYDELLAYAGSIAKRSGVQNMKEISMLAAEAHYYKGDYAKAAEAYEGFLKDSPGSAEGGLLFRAGFSNYALDRSEKAMSYLSRSAATRDSVSYYASYYLGIVYLRNGEKPLALNAFDYARRVPSDPKLGEEASFHFAKVSYDAGRTDQAIQEFEKFLSEYPGSPHSDEVKEWLAQAYVHGNNFSKAIEYIESLPSKNQQIQQAYQKATYLMGSELFNMNSYEEAIRAFGKSLAFPRESTYVALASFWAGEAYSMIGKPEDAIPHYQKVITTNPADPALIGKARYGMGYAYFNIKNYERALFNFREFTSKSGANTPNYVDGLIRLGDCYYVSKQYDIALSTYNSARNIGSPDNDYILLQTGMINGIRQNYTESRNHFTSLIENYPRSPHRDEALYQRAQFEIEQGNYQAAVDGLSRLIRESAHSRFLPYAYMRRASAYYNLRQYDQTAADYGTVIRQFTSHPVAQEALLPLQDALSQAGKAGEFDSYMAHFRRANPENRGLEAIEFEAAKNAFFDEKYSQAAASLSSFISQYPQSARLQEARYYVAESHFRMQDYLKALPTYEALAQDRNFNLGNRVVSRAAEIHFQQGNYPRAISYFHQLERLATNKVEQYTAWSGLMDAFFRVAQYDSSDLYARTIVERGAVSAGGQNKASLSLGKSALQRGDYEGAKDEFINTLNTAQDEYGAEAKYLLAEIQFRQKEYKQSYETLLSLTEHFAAYDEWVGKAFLLMADNFLAMDQVFQARATLQSLVDNFPLQPIKNAATAKLRDIDRLEADRKRKLEADTLDNDTIQN